MRKCIDMRKGRSHSEEQAQKVLDEIVAAGGTAITYKAGQQE